jgi:hypothetical protein
MPITTDTFVERISLAETDDLEKAIIETCELHSARNKARRLTAAFESHGHVILIFQVSADQ